MEAIQTFGLLPFVGVCAGIGAVAFFITRAVTPAKPCSSNLLNHPKYPTWASQEGEYTHFESGKRRLVHVSRTSIGWNLKNGNDAYPTCIVIDEHGEKHEFHEVFMHEGGGTLLYDQDGETAKVYIVTHGRISGRRVNNLESPPLSYSPVEEKLREKTRQAEQLQRQFDDAQELLRLRESDLQTLRKNAVDELKNSKDTAEKGYQQAYEIINDLRSRLYAAENELKNKVMEPSGDIDLQNQTKRVRKERPVRVGKGCDTYWDTEYYYENVPLAKGDEGYIDTENQVRYCRVLQRNPVVVTEAIPLTEGDIGYRDPNEPTPC